MPAVVDARSHRACCAVRGGLVVSGGISSEDVIIGSVEMLVEGEGAFTGQPPLTRGGIAGAVAIVAIESGSAARQVRLFGGYGADHNTVSTVDLATGSVHSATKSPL